MLTQFKKFEVKNPQKIYGGNTTMHQNAKNTIQNIRA